MQVNVAGLRRAAKNIAHNYTDPQKKVREATSNDPWGPSSTLMSEIADLTYNIEAFSQIMEMLWKRLNDHGKNWRHVYKSLVLLEYLIKTGSERVAQQCKENIFAIQTLKDFQHLEDNKDQGLNVREKAKQLVVLLTSEEKLRNERTRALKARERFAQSISGFGSSDSNDTTPTSPVFSSHFAGENGYGGTGTNGRGVGSHRGERIQNPIASPELEQARPQTIGEEELQLQLALAMSKEEAEQEEKRRRSDDLRLQMALSQSEQEFKSVSPPKRENASALVDLLDVDLGGAVGGAVGGVAADPWAPVSVPMPTAGNSDTWSSSNSTVTSPQGNDPWASPVPAAVAIDPWNPNSTSPAPKVVDPWAPAPTTQPSIMDEFDAFSRRKSNESEMSPITPTNAGLISIQQSKSKNPMEFLGENSGLVNLDNLLPTKSPSPSFANASNPFGLGSGNPGAGGGGASNNTGPVNPFHLQNPIQKPSINEIREKQQKEQLLLGQGIGFQQPQIPQNNPWSPI